MKKLSWLLTFFAGCSTTRSPYHDPLQRDIEQRANQVVDSVGSHVATRGRPIIFQIIGNIERRLIDFLGWCQTNVWRTLVLSVAAIVVIGLVLWHRHHITGAWTAVVKHVRRRLRREA